MKSIEVWHDLGNEWIDYSLEELDRYFKFVHKLDWSKVNVIYVHDAGANAWMEVYFKAGYTKVYNSVFGTFTE